MSIYNKFVKHITLPLLLKKDGQCDLLRHLEFLNTSQYWTKEKIENYQFEKIKKLCIHAYQNTEFYKKRFDQCGFDPFLFEKIDDLKVIPPLTKEDIKTELEKIRAGNFADHEIHKDGTGGSTGTRTPFYRDNKCLVFKKAIEYRCNSWTGWDVGDKIAYYWPAIQDFQKKQTLKSKIKNLLSNRSLMLYSGKLDDKILEEHYQKLKNFKPKLLRTFPNPLYILANYIKKNNKEKLIIPAIISVGEPLLDKQRDLFTEVFRSNVFNCYVSRECGNMACECEEHKYLHVNDEMVYFEYSEDNASSKILITDLVNYGMPFIRYQIEDIGIEVKQSCSCGRNSSLLNMEAGRISDFLISPVDKSFISGASFLHHLIAEGPDVGQIQIIQDEVNHLIIKIVKNSNYSEKKLEHFDSVIKRIFKNKMLYDIEFVSKIDREKSGKYLFTKSLVR